MSAGVILIKYTLIYAVVMMLVALGGMYSERSGIINIALEGIMVIGGLTGVLAINLMPEGSSAIMIVIVSILVASLSGLIYALLLAFACINLKADQTIGGTALNMMATALAMVVAKAFNSIASGKASASSKITYSNKYFLFDIGDLQLNVFLPIGIVILIIAAVVLYRTKFGLRLMACGCSPQAMSRRPNLVRYSTTAAMIRITMPRGRNTFS